MADGFRPAQLRVRALDFREQAKRESDQRRASQLRQLAEALEQEADALTRFEWSEAARPPLRVPSHWRPVAVAESG
jgi:acyl-CoA reductase-like NAD-dependent aldehyde dehydrogenase